MDERVRYEFNDLSLLPDQISDCFQQWTVVDSEDAAFAFAAEPLLQAQVALFEWMANLVQHARFGERTPFVRLDLELSEEGVACVVEDNSDGFDFAASLARRREELRAMPERGMGLLLLHATAREVRYDDLGPHCHRISFHIPVHADAPGLDLTATSDHV